MNRMRQRTIFNVRFELMHIFMGYFPSFMDIIGLYIYTLDSSNTSKTFTLRYELGPNLMFYKHSIFLSL